MQYFFDQEKEELHFTAIAFCSDTRGVATGVLTSEGGTKPTSVVTANGGDHWTLTPTQEIGTALFFLEETAGWMVTESGIWFTDECGRSWRRIYKQRGLTDVRFVSRERGWAIGARKTVIETSDGGKTWTPVKDVRELDMDTERTTFHAIEFVDTENRDHVSEIGRSHDSEIPLWLDPEPEKPPGTARTVRQSGNADGGETWTPTKCRCSDAFRGSGWRKTVAVWPLVEFEDYFEFPSELYRLDPKVRKIACFAERTLPLRTSCSRAKRMQRDSCTSGGVFRSLFREKSELPRVRT